MGRPLYLVAYDVRSPRRWRRVFTILKGRGAHRQLSVFLLRLEVAGLRRLRDDLAAVIDPAQDSVLIARVEGATTGLTELGLSGPVPAARVVVL